MKIAIALTGRSHLLNLAKYLISQGHEVLFYTSIPKSRCKKFGLDAKYVKSFFPILFWLYVYRFIKKASIRAKIFELQDYLVDRCIALTLKRCDVFIGASTVTVHSMVKAKKKYNAVVICDCGTKHVIEQNAKLKMAPNAALISKTVIGRELRNYMFSDYITVPSYNSLESFVKQGVSSDKIFRNPYGVDLGMFRPTIKSLKINTYDVIIVGYWRYIKGVDLLSEACMDMGLSLLHVGPYLSNCPFPDYHLFTHVDAVDETQLINYYQKAKILALPSRADGLGLVIIQAVAAGLPVVYSKDTGGRDIKELCAPNSDFMIEMGDFSVESLKNCLKVALNKYYEMPENELRQYVPEDNFKEISWNSYGRRYNDFIQKIVNENHVIKSIKTV